MTTKPTDKQRRAALYAATQAERTAQLNLRAASINRAWHEMKLKHPDAILLFRVGDFYEIYGEDAKAASDTLGLTLCRRDVGSNVGNDVGKTISLCGFPHHALDSYLPKLVRAGGLPCGYHGGVRRDNTPDAPRVGRYGQMSYRWVIAAIMP